MRALTINCNADRGEEQCIINAIAIFIQKASGVVKDMQLKFILSDFIFVADNCRFYVKDAVLC